MGKEDYSKGLLEVKTYLEAQKAQKHVKLLQGGNLEVLGVVEGLYSGRKTDRKKPPWPKSLPAAYIQKLVLI